MVHAIYAVRNAVWELVYMKQIRLTQVHVFNVSNVLRAAQKKMHGLIKNMLYSLELESQL